MNFIGVKVYGIDGPGQSPRDGLAGSIGRVVSEEKNPILGEMVTVEWTEGHSAGHTENFFKYQLHPASDPNGIGVYYQN